LLAPGRAARGEMVTHGDAFATALDYGLLGAPMAAPEGALRANSFRAYHGSPHTFDRFSMDRIGTGEGAQAYGHGLYFAENEAIAQSYRDALSSGLSNWTVDGVPVSRLHGSADPMDAVKLNFGQAVREGRSPTEAIDWLQMQYRGKASSRFVEPENVAYFNDQIARLEELRAAPPVVNYNPGSMYEVQINADPNTFLDWDAPLSQQTQDVQWLAQDNKANLANRGVFVDSDPRASSLIQAMRPEEYMREGIPGIRYLDAGSRTPLQADDLARSLADYDRQIANAEREIATMPEGFRADYQGHIDRLVSERAAVARKANPSRNFVVFDDSLIQILRRYGIGAAAVGGGWAVTPEEYDAVLAGEF